MPAWIGADVTQADVQGDQDSAGRGGSGDDIRVSCAGKSFGGNGVHVMADLGEDSGSRDGQVLVKLEFHRGCGIGSSSSRAKAAP